MKKLMPLVFLFVLAIPRTVHAQFVGGIVYDPTNYQNALLRYYQLQQHLIQLERTYAEIVNQYNLAVTMAKNIQNMPARYQALFSAWHNLTTVPNVYGNTGGWVNGVNTGSPSIIQNGYQSATNPVQPYSPTTITNANASELQRIFANFATLELRDGVNTNAMQTVGNIRANAPVVQTKIANLEQDSLSNAPSLNTEVGVLNKINATNILILRTLQDANNLRLAEVEQQIVLSKQQRDEVSNVISGDVYQRQNMMSQINQITIGLGTTLQNFRLP
jgi:type IV secretion system protein TrbJ